MIDQAVFNAFCAGLPKTTHVVQWEGADVWKVGGKMFAIGDWRWGGLAGITFKVSDMAYDILKDMPGLRPAPYLASRGMKWIQHYEEPGLDAESLKDHLRISHLIVARGLSKRLQRELGLDGLGLEGTKP